MTVNEASSLIHTERIAGNKVIASWADMGCGDGLFTLALSRMLPAGSTIYAIDKIDSLRSRTTNSGIKIIALKKDFVFDDPGLENLDGILMANSLHYVKDKPSFIRKMETHLKPGALYLIVEYDTDNPVTGWVPYPLGFLSLTELFKRLGYLHIQKLSERASVYGRRNMYSALIGR